MPGDVIRVDVDALEALAGECGAVAEQMDGLLDGQLDTSVATMGDAGLSEVLDRYNGRWSERRKLLGEELHAAAAALDASAASFRDIDENLACALDGRGGGSG